MKLKQLKPIALALSISSLCMASSSVFAGGPTYKVIVNEFYRAGNLTSTDEWAEILLLEDLTAAQLNTYFVGDSTGSTAAKFSSYQFTDMVNIAPTFCAGTMITVGGTTGPATDIVYNPALNDWNISLQTAGANITSTTGAGNFAGDDVVYIDTVDTGNTLTADGFAINWDDTPGTFGTNATFNLSTGSNEPNNNTGAFLNDSFVSAATEASWVSDTVLGSLTPGAVNGGNNTTSIQALQAAALGTVTIADSPTNNEGDAGNTAFTFTVTRTASCAAASVDYAVTGTGANPADAADFGGVLPSGTANFAAGNTTATITIDVSGDTDVEMDETFLVTISNPAGVALGATTTDTGTISNDDILVSNLSIDDVTQVEGDAGTTTFDFTVSIDNTADATVQVDTSDGSATTADSDYVAIAAQIVTFTNGGPLTQTVSVTVNGDTTIEGNETFNVNLSNALGATIADNQGVGTITNDDSVQAILSVIKSVSGDLTPGGLIAYDIVITNSGPNPQNDNPGDEMTDVLPASLIVQSVTATSGTPSNVGNTVSWNGSIPAAGTVTVTVNALVDVNAAGSIENQAEVFFDNDGDGTNESNALSSPPMGMGPAPTVFFIPYMIPTLGTYGLILMSLLMLVFVARRKMS